MRTISIGYLVDEAQAMIWRGPMASSAVMQLLHHVRWPRDEGGELDLLLLDLPPGTGDIHLTLAQQAPISAALVITTPQQVALIDCRKALTMFRKLSIPCLGVVENMREFVCPHCGGTSDLFARDGARRLAEEEGIPLLGGVPLDPAIRRCSDGGRPVVIAEPESRSAAGFRAIAEAIVERIERLPRRVKVEIPVVPG